MMMNNNGVTTVEQKKIINSCKIKENNKPAKSKGKSTVDISVSMKPELAEKVKKMADECNMNRSQYIAHLISESDKKIISFPEGKEILAKIALAHQILTDIMEDKENNIPQERLDDAISSLNKAADGMYCICYKMDALIPDDKEDNGNDN